MAAFQPSDPVFATLDNAKRSVAMMKPEMQDKYKAGFSASVGSYPMPTLTRAVLWNALDAATPQSVVEFGIAYNLLRRQHSSEGDKSPVSVALLRMLKDENNNPVFWKVCSEFKESIVEQLPDVIRDGIKIDQEKDSKRATDEMGAEFIEDINQYHHSRREMMRMVGKGMLGVMVGDAVLTPWTKKDAKGNTELNGGKLVRLGAEGAGAVLAGRSVLGHSHCLLVSHLIEDITPFIEKEVGVEASPLTSRTYARG